MQQVTPPSATAPDWRGLLGRAVSAPLGRAFGLSPTRVAFLGAHPDDETFAAGATLAGLSRSGHEVHIASMTAGEGAWDKVSSRPDDIATVRRGEFATATRLLGARSSWIGGLPDGGLLASIEAVSTTVAALLLDIRPEVVLTVWWNDPHPDHQAVGMVARHLAGEMQVPVYGFPIWAHHWMPAHDAPESHQFTVLETEPADRETRARATKAYASQTGTPQPGIEPVLPESFLEWDIEYFVHLP